MLDRAKYGRIFTAIKIKNMNIKTKTGLALLDAILAESAWKKHYEQFEGIFDDADIDWINHSISTEING